MPESASRKKIDELAQLPEGSMGDYHADFAIHLPKANIFDKVPRFWKNHEKPKDKSKAPLEVCKGPAKSKRATKEQKHGKRTSSQAAHTKAKKETHKFRELFKGVKDLGSTVYNFLGHDKSAQAPNDTPPSFANYALISPLDLGGPINDTLLAFNIKDSTCSTQSASAADRKITRQTTLTTTFPSASLADSRRPVALKELESASPITLTVPPLTDFAPSNSVTTEGSSLGESVSPTSSLSSTQEPAITHTPTSECKPSPKPSPPKIWTKVKASSSKIKNRISPRWKGQEPKKQDSGTEFSLKSEQEVDHNDMGNTHVGCVKSEGVVASNGLNHVLNIGGLNDKNPSDFRLDQERYEPNTIYDVDVEKIVADVKITTTTSAKSGGEEPCDRRDYEAIRAIGSMKLKRILEIYVGTYRKLRADAIRIKGRTEGAYHHVVFLQLNDHGTIEDYVIKIPLHGTAARWTEGDEQNLRGEAELMKHVYTYTNFPIPAVIAYSDKLDIILGHPYILMTHLPGRSAYDMWLGKPDGSNDSEGWRITDFPSDELQAKRVTFLRSLAHHMAALQTLSFDAIGMPVFDRRTEFLHIGPSYHFQSNLKKDMDKATPRGPFASTMEYTKHAIDDIFQDLDGDDVSMKAYRDRGLRIILEIVFSCPVFNPRRPETFVLRHDDLDLQNILTDENGNVTGIIDWDGCLASPRCVGYAAVPKFLRRDWFPNYTLDRMPNMACMTEVYREIYAQAMLETGTPDADYTLSSALYQAAFGALYEGGGLLDFIYKVLENVKGMRYTDPDELAERLGQGWSDMEKYLQNHIPKVFEPQLPGSSSSLNLSSTSSLDYDCP